MFIDYHQKWKSNEMSYDMSLFIFYNFEYQDLWFRGRQDSFFHENQKNVNVFFYENHQNFHIISFSTPEKTLVNEFSKQKGVQKNDFFRASGCENKLNWL